MRAISSYSEIADWELQPTVADQLSQEYCTTYIEPKNQNQNMNYSKWVLLSPHYKVEKLLIETFKSGTTSTLTIK